ncbi:hypothetical protein DPMN_171522 [Dreissena polymorpha]|uniref:Uncharacterized protein n=1 Tax=Dreissena polymorpha TaxID=45954 RepID=A0A9D4IFN3_DREPO|nr:hypothetical protein DPMN_171522 [Dreissena polymorpha]
MLVITFNAVSMTLPTSGVCNHARLDLFTGKALTPANRLNGIVPRLLLFFSY